MLVYQRVGSPNYWPHGDEAWIPTCLENPGLVKVATRNSPSIAAASHEAITICYNDIFRKKGEVAGGLGPPQTIDSVPIARIIQENKANSKVK